MSKRRRVFSLAGIDFFATRLAVLSGGFFFMLGVAVTLAEQADRQIGEIARIGAVYGLILFFSNMIHSLGHLIAGKLVGASKGALVVTSTFHINYHLCDSAICTKWKHIGRSLGGPSANLLVGLIAAVMCSTTDSRWLHFMGDVNIIVGVCLLLPLPRIDGWVIWGELLGFSRRANK